LLLSSTSVRKLWDLKSPLSGYVVVFIAFANWPPDREIF
jgi:hypothetical protein